MRAVGFLSEAVGGLSTRRTLARVLVAGAVSLAAAPIEAATYYVSQSGSDSNSCASAQSTTQSNQKVSISAGVACLSAGDTLYIHGGRYTGAVNAINSQATTVNGGADFAARALVIAAYPGESVTIAVGSAYSNNAISLQSATQQYIVFDHLILDGTGMGPWAGGIYQGPGSSHIRFQNGEIRNFPGQGVNSSASGGGDLQLLSNHIHHNGGNTTPQTHNVYLLTSNNVIDGNEIDHGAYFGITIYDSSARPSNNVVRNNRVHDNCIYGGNEIGVGGGSNNQVYNNLVYGQSNGYAIDVEYAAPSSTLIDNNTVVLTGGIHIGSDASGTQVSNNIVRSTFNGGPTVIQNSGTNSIVSNNVTGDPMFVNASTNDFHLQWGSPAIDAGLAVSGIVLDFDGRPRPQGIAIDVGAYEYGIFPPANVRVLQ